VQPKDGISAELADKATDIPSTKTANSSLESLNVNSDKVVVDRISQAATVENISKEQSVAAQEKQPVMTSAQLQALQQVQTQQKVQSVSSDQQVIDDAGEEFIDAMLLAEAKPIEQDVKTTGKVIDNIAMRTVSELQAQTVQATQTKQSDDAYLDHQVSEVLNHNVASDTAQIQKNNIQLQQETLSMTRKDFADAVKDKVMITINQKLQQFDITLDPPEFGNMQVRVNLQGEQATVNFVVQNQQAKDALEQNMHKLKDMLSEQGVDVGGANVEQQDQQQSQGEQSLGQNNDNGSALRNGAQKEEHNIDHILSAKLFDSSATGVDYYA
ncbi:MAG: flagellar hook-length control protein FliK, partial [Colwellia sp.]